MSIFLILLPNQVFCQKLTKLLTISASGNPLQFFQFSTGQQKTKEHFLKFCSKLSLLSKVNQTVDYKSFRKCTFVFLVFQGRTKTNEHFSKFASKSSFLSKVNQIVDYKCFRKSSFVFLVFQGRTKTNDHFSKFASKSSFLSKVNQIVDCQCFRKSTVVFAVFHGRTTAYMFQHISESLLTA